MPIDNWSEQVVVVHLADDPQFTDDMEALDQSRLKSKLDVVLDFTAVRFINSSNISRLLKLRKQMQNDGCRLVVCGVSTQVWSALLITGLDKIFQFSDNVPTALATLAMKANEK
jgi:anti-anti-sigma factor